MSITNENVELIVDAIKGGCRDAVVVRSRADNCRSFRLPNFQPTKCWFWVRPDDTVARTDVLISAAQGDELFCPSRLTVFPKEVKKRKTIYLLHHWGILSAEELRLLKSAVEARLLSTH